jgi:hypothetical protein
MCNCSFCYSAKQSGLEICFSEHSLDRLWSLRQIEVVISLTWFTCRISNIDDYWMIETQFKTIYRRNLHFIDHIIGNNTILILDGLRNESNLIWIIYWVLPYFWCSKVSQSHVIIDVVLRYSRTKKRESEHFLECDDWRFCHCEDFECRISNHDNQINEFEQPMLIRPPIDTIWASHQ